MDNHPIPQDVTGFQFRLIGDMTIKQFAYLAGGMILAWIFLASPLFIFCLKQLVGNSDGLFTELSIFVYLLLVHLFFWRLRDV